MSVVETTISKWKQLLLALIISNRLLGINWLQMCRVPGNCKPLAWQTTEGNPSQTWQTEGGSFLLLPRRQLSVASDCELSTTTHVWNRLEEVQGAASSFLFPPPLFQDTWPRVQLLCCEAQCSMPVRLDHWQSQTSNVCSEMTGQWSDRSAMSSSKTMSPPDPMSYLRGLALRIRTSFWRREGSTCMDMWIAPMGSQDSLWHTGWWKAWAWKAQNDMEAADREGLQRVEALGYWPSWQTYLKI